MNFNKIINKECIERLTIGEISAFDEIYHAYKKRTYFFVKKIVKTTEDAEGIIQELFIKIWDNREKIDSEKSLEALLFKIAYNMSIDFLRKKSKEKEYLDTLTLAPIATSLDTENQVNFNLLQERIDHIVADFPPQLKKVFTMSRKRGLSNREIASQLQISSNTVENQLVTALKKIKKGLGKAMLFFIGF